jgi:hypothetical protein
MFAFREVMIMDICSMIGNPEQKLANSMRWKKVAHWLADRMISAQPKNKLATMLTLQHFINEQELFSDESIYALFGLVHTQYCKQM